MLTSEGKLRIMNTSFTHIPNDLQTRRTTADNNSNISNLDHDNKNLTMVTTNRAFSV